MMGVQVRSGGASVVTTPAAPGVHNQPSERGAHVTSTMAGGSERRGEISGIANLYLTQL